MARKNIGNAQVNTEADEAPQDTLLVGDGGIEIDYSGIKEQPVGISKTRWKPPKHVYFGPKDPDTGEMLPEPEYEYKEYPRMMYMREGRKVRAILVNDDEEKEVALKDGFKLSPGECGLITAPSFEQVQAAKRAAAAETQEG